MNDNADVRTWQHRGLRPIERGSPDADVYARLRVLFASILSNHSTPNGHGELTEEDRETMQELMRVIMAREAK